MKFILLTILTINSALAIENDFSSWLGTFIKKPINEKYSIWMDAQVRYSLDSGQTAQTLYRSGLFYQYDENFEYGVMYANFQTNGISEHRPTFDLNQDFGTYQDMNLTSRARLELRFFENLTNDHLRARYLLRLETDKNYVIWNEVFVNLTENKLRKDDIFDRNWLFIGKKFIKDEFRIEAGYLNRYVPIDDESVMEHTAVVYFFL